MVIRQRQRQHQAFGHLAIFQNQLIDPARHAQNRYFRIIYDRRKRCTANPSEVGDELVTLHFFSFKFTIAGSPAMLVNSAAT